MEENQLEIADALADAERATGIAAARAFLAPQSDPDFDGEHCIGCDAVIQIERLNAGRIRCTRCETERESRKKRGLPID